MDTRQPNFIIIFTDDQRYDAVGYTGNDVIHTPNLDAIAAQGTRFANAFVTTSVCSPSRAALLTGRYGSANGVLRFGHDQRLNPGETTLAQRLQKAGYRTAHIGKWHLHNPPDSLGFEVSPHFISNGPYYDRKVWENGQEKTAEGFIEDFNAAHAIAFLEQVVNGEEPFLLMLNTQVPHMDHHFDWPAGDSTLSLYHEEDMPVPASWNDDLTGKPEYLKHERSRQKALDYGYGTKDGIQRHLKRYYAVITEMDRAVGEVLKAADRLGLRENTYVVFMADNGWFIGDHGFTSKVLPYEESIRVPFVIAGPGIDSRTDSSLVLNVDVAPTLLTLADLPVPEEMHGQSLIPVLKGDKSSVRNEFYYEAPEPQLGSWPLVAIRTHRWKYIQTFDIDDPERLVFEELYDLEQDPGEMHNLVGQPEYAAIQAELLYELKRLQAEVVPGSGPL